MTEIFNQLPSIAVILEYITDGFFLGALAGAVLGASVLVIMERGTFSFFPLIIAGFLGIFVGIYIEGDVIRSLGSRDWTTFFSGPVAFRASVFEAVIKIIGWSFVTMVLGAFISNYKLAFRGVLVGGLMGTLSGILIVVMGTELGFPVDSPIAIVAVVIISAILMVITSAGQEQEIR